MKIPGLLVFLLFLVPLAAQTTLDYGVKTGFNLSQHYGTKGDEGDFEVKTGMRPGFIGGAWLDLNLLPHFSLGYELLYSMKGSREQITIRRVEIDGVMEDLVQPAVMDVLYYLDYVELPVLLKIKVVERNTWSLAAITGTAMALKVKGKHRLDGVIYFPDGDDVTEIPLTEESSLENVNMFDYSFVYGGNIEFKTKLPLILEYRFTLGWDYLNLPTFQLFDPVSLRNQTHSLLLGTRF